MPMYEIMQKETFGDREVILCENHTKRLVATRHFCAKITQSTWWTPSVFSQKNY